MAASDREIGGDGQLFAGAEADQGAVVADAQPQAATGGLGNPAANLLEQCEFAVFPGCRRSRRFRSHSLRIGQIGA
jgi:hypothetical protein